MDEFGVRHTDQAPPICWLSESAYQISGVDVEGAGDAQDVVEAEVALAALDLADDCPVQFGLVSQGLLGQSQLLASSAYPCSELASCW